jgi:hypothetical protein
VADYQVFVDELVSLRNARQQARIGIERRELRRSMH